MFYNNTILVDFIVCVLPVMLRIHKLLYVMFITMFCCLKFDCFQMPEMCLHGLYICSMFFMHFRQVREFTNLWNFVHLFLVRWCWFSAIQLFLRNFVVFTWFYMIMMFLHSFLRCCMFFSWFSYFFIGLHVFHAFLAILGIFNVFSLFSDVLCVLCDFPCFF
jgi:hypothetical protein